MALCAKCETILNVSTLQGAGPVRCRITNGVFGIENHEQAKNGVGADVWLNATESALAPGLETGAINDADGGGIVVPNKIGRITFTSTEAEDGKCPHEHTSGPTGTCYGVDSIKECKSEMKLSWTWTNATAIGMGISAGKRYGRDCIGPGDEDEAFITTDANYWKTLATAGVATTGFKMFGGDETVKCGYYNEWTVTFYDENVGVNRAGIIANYFTIKIGCEGCCMKDELD